MIPLSFVFYSSNLKSWKTSIPHILNIRGNTRSLIRFILAISLFLMERDEGVTTTKMKHIRLFILSKEKNMTKDLSIEITKRNGFQSVSARELHIKLNCEERFSKWWNRMVNYGFKEEQDFVVCTKKYTANQYGGEKEFADYELSLDMAKELCMIQRSEIGRKFRQYFIEVEKRYQEKKSEPYKRIRDKSKLTRVVFTDSLKKHGCDKFYHYINITNAMKFVLGISSSKDDMTIPELSKVIAAESLAEAILYNEQGYYQVKPTCIKASNIVIRSIEENKKQLPV